MRVAIEIDEKVWKRLADMATTRNQRVGQFAGQVIADALDKHSDLAERVIVLVLRGMCDADIACELDLTNLQVKTFRTKAGLEANKRPGTWVRRARKDNAA